MTDLRLRCRELPRLQELFPGGGGQSGEVDLVVAVAPSDDAFEIRGAIVKRGAAPPSGVQLVIEVEAEELRGDEAAREIVGRLDELL